APSELRRIASDGLPDDSPDYRQSHTLDHSSEAFLGLAIMKHSRPRGHGIMGASPGRRQRRIDMASPKRRASTRSCADLSTPTVRRRSASVKEVSLRKVPLLETLVRDSSSPEMDAIHPGLTVCVHLFNG